MQYQPSSTAKDIEGRENLQSSVTVWMSLVLGVAVLPREIEELVIFVEKVIK